MANFYHASTKYLIGAFGALFSDIHIIRRFKDTVDGAPIQDIKVPISYAAKEKWYQMLTSQATREKQVNTVLPKLSYEITGFSYDASRKRTRSMDVKCVDEEGKATRIATPAPWNVDITLYIVSNKQEDCLQILEQILPLFNPDRTLYLRSVKDMNITSNVPISLTSVNIDDSYEGDFTSHRIIIYSLSFVAKMWYYGEVKDAQIITDVELDMGGTGEGGSSPNGKYQITIDGQSGIIINEGWDWEVIEHTDSLDNPNNEIVGKSPEVRVNEVVWH